MYICYSAVDAVDPLHVHADAMWPLARHHTQVII